VGLQIFFCQGSGPHGRGTVVVIIHLQHPKRRDAVVLL
jgi:hypothetical protein